MNKGKVKVFESIKIATLLAMFLTGAAFSITACSPQQIVTGPGVSGTGSTPTPTFTVNPNYVPSSATPNSAAGSIALTGILENGDSSFSFVNTTTLSNTSPTTIYFTNYGWDQTLNGGTGGFVDASVTIGPSAPATNGTGVSEGTISFVVPTTSALTSSTYNQVVIGKVGDDSSTYGTEANVTPAGSNSNSNTTNPYLVLNHNGLGNKIFAYMASGPVAPGASTAGITFINAVIFGPSGWNALQGASISATDFSDSYLPWAPTYSFSNGNQTPPSSGAFTNFCALDLSVLFNAVTTANSAGTSGAGGPIQNQNLVLSTCESTLNGIENGTLWTGNDEAKTSFLIGTGAAGNTSCSTGSAGYNVTFSPEASY